VQKGNGTDSFQNKTGIPQDYDHGGKQVSQSGNAFISSLFMPFFRESHRWALYQRRYYD
jgi:hypothetical protein